MSSPSTPSGRITRRAIVAAAAAAALLPLGGVAAGTDAPGTGGPAAGPPGRGEAVKERWIRQPVQETQN